MPINLHCSKLPISEKQVKNLWRHIQTTYHVSDTTINIKCVSSSRIQNLNKKYRKQDQPTNVLTFSYKHEHDIAICLKTIKEEAIKIKHHLPDYTALVVTHALLHVIGFDHKTKVDAKTMKDIEKNILIKCRFSPIKWF